MTTHVALIQVTKPSKAVTEIPDYALNFFVQTHIIDEIDPRFSDLNKILRIGSKPLEIHTTDDITIYH